MVDPPEGLPPERAAAFEVLAAGGSLGAAAEAAAKAIGRPKPYSTGTVQKWVAGWRLELGGGLFRSERQVEAAQQTVVARQAAEQAWADLRTAEARNLGVTASQIRARLLALLPSVATQMVDRGTDGSSSPIVLHGPDARQVKALADAAARLVETAELLDGRPTRHSRRSVPSDQYDPRPLPGAGGPMPREQAEATVTSLTERLREKRAAGS